MSILTGKLVLPEAEPKLSDDEEKYVAWTQIQFGLKAANDLKLVLMGWQKGFQATSMVDEHRIRQEGGRRGIQLHTRPLGSSACA